MEEKERGGRERREVKEREGGELEGEWGKVGTE